MATGRQLVSRRCVLIESLLLEGREPGFYHGPDSAILDLLVTDGAVTYLLDQIKSSLCVNDRQLEFGIPLR